MARTPSLADLAARQDALVRQNREIDTDALFNYTDALLNPTNPLLQPVGL
jgi:hypothetical protein